MIPGPDWRGHPRLSLYAPYNQPLHTPTQRLTAELLLHSGGYFYCELLFIVHLCFFYESTAPRPENKRCFLNVHIYTEVVSGR